MINHARQIVTDQTRNTERLPDCFAEYAVVAAGLHAAGFFDALGRRLKVKRNGGYAAVDAVLFVLLYFCSRVDGGFKGLFERVGCHGAQLGAISGRCGVMSQASLSRFTAKVDATHVSDEFATWLLVEAPEAAEVLASPLAASYDTKGTAWHCFDLDGTLVGLRRRGLPIHDELPPPERVDESLAAAGYPGRKRCQVQLMRSTLQHAGSGLYVGLWCEPGNGDGLAGVRKSALAIKRCAELASLDRAQCLLRCDGFYGNWSLMESCRAAGINHLVRWKGYDQILHNLDGRLKSATWHQVPDSGSGVTRYATDLGYLDGPVDTEGCPLLTRLIVSRFVDTSDRGVGIHVGGYRYELYATSLPQGAWPAADVVSLYYGRTVEENRFGQEDNEIGLDRIFSLNLYGQYLVSLVGLFVWNLRTIRGWRLTSVLPTPPPQLPRQVRVEPDIDVAVRRREALAPNPLIEALGTEMDRLALPNCWCFSEGRGLQCPAGNLTPLKRIRTDNTGESLVFRALVRACRYCAIRPTCTTSTQPSFAKEIQLRVSPEFAKLVRQLTKARNSSVAPIRAATHREPASVHALKPPLNNETGPHEPAGPYLVPSVLRRGFRLAALKLEVWVHLSGDDPNPSHLRHIAPTAAKRQQRRQTWDERHQRYALPSSAHLRIDFRGYEPGDAAKVLATGNVERKTPSMAA